jgi:hypothetical protein
VERPGQTDVGYYWNNGMLENWNNALRGMDTVKK